VEPIYLLSGFHSKVNIKSTKGAKELLLEFCYHKFLWVYLCSLSHNLAHKQDLTSCESVLLLTVVLVVFVMTLVTILIASAWVYMGGFSSIITIAHLALCLRLGSSCAVGMHVVVFLPAVTFTEVCFWDRFISATSSFMVVVFWVFSCDVAKF